MNAYNFRVINRIIEWPDGRTSRVALCDRCAAATKKLSGADIEWDPYQEPDDEGPFVCTDCGTEDTNPERWRYT